MENETLESMYFQFPIEFHEDFPVNELLDEWEGKIWRLQLPCIFRLRDVGQPSLQKIGSTYKVWYNLWPVGPEPIPYVNGLINMSLPGVITPQKSGVMGPYL